MKKKTEKIHESQFKAEDRQREVRKDEKAIRISAPAAKTWDPAALYF